MDDLKGKFIETIQDGVAKLNQYKNDVDSFTQGVDGWVSELTTLIDQLEACIADIEALQKEYLTFIQQLELIQSNLNIQISIHTLCLNNNL